MCFIYSEINFKNKSFDEDQILNSFNMMNYRAPDKISIFTNDKEVLKNEKVMKNKNISKVEYFSKKANQPKIIISHGRLKIINDITQPIKRNKSYLVCNGEIYNYKELNQIYNKKNKSDCAIILDIYEQIKSNFYKKNLINTKEKDYKFKEIIKYKKFLKEFSKRIEKQIIGEYSFVIFDLELNKILLSKDHIGTRPLFYFLDENKLIISSENINNDISFNNMNFNEILFIDLNDYNNEKIMHQIKKQKLIKTNLFQKKANQEEIETLIEKSIYDRVKDQKKVGILFSGGIDSTIIAYYAKKYTKVILYCAGERNSKDIKNAKEIAKVLNLDLRINYLNKENIIKLNQKAKEIIDKAQLNKKEDLMHQSIISTIYHASELAKKDKIKVILSGSGADELFLGYNKFKQLLDNKTFFSKILPIITKLKLNKLRKQELESHFKKNIIRDEITVIQHCTELRLPFMDKKLIRMILKIRYQDLIDKEKKEIIRKLPLIKIARKIKNKDWKKIAAQYGSNSQKLILKTKKNK